MRVPAYFEPEPAPGYEAPHYEAPQPYEGADVDVPVYEAAWDSPDLPGEIAWAA